MLANSYKKCKPFVFLLPIMHNVQLEVREDTYKKKVFFSGRTTKVWVTPTPKTLVVQN